MFAELRAAEDDSEEMSERDKDTKAGLLNNLAWVLATSPEDALRDGERSIKLATEASELTDYKAAYILSTLASAYAESGDFEAARKWAKKAVELAEDDEQRVGLQEELDSYLKNEAWREIENVEADKEKKEKEKSSDGSNGKDAEDNKKAEDKDSEQDDDKGSEKDESDSSEKERASDDD